MEIVMNQEIWSQKNEWTNLNIQRFCVLQQIPILEEYTLHLTLKTFKKCSGELSKWLYQS